MDKKTLKTKQQLIESLLKKDQKTDPQAAQKRKTDGSEVLGKHNCPSFTILQDQLNQEQKKQPVAAPRTSAVAERIMELPIGAVMVLEKPAPKPRTVKS